ncbi:hypothetical protein ACJJTC_016948 [Scirpophaga incertulas]
MRYERIRLKQSNDLTNTLLRFGTKKFSTFNNSNRQTMESIAKARCWVCVAVPFEKRSESAACNCADRIDVVSRGRHGLVRRRSFVTAPGYVMGDREDNSFFNLKSVV